MAKPERATTDLLHIWILGAFKSFQTAVTPQDPQTKASELHYRGIFHTSVFSISFFVAWVFFFCLLLPGNSTRPLKLPGTLRALPCNKLHPALHVRLERFYWTRSQDPAEQKALPPRGKLKHINYFIFLTTPGAKQKKNPPERLPNSSYTQRTLRPLLTAAESDRPELPRVPVTRGQPCPPGGSHTLPRRTPDGRGRGQRGPRQRQPPRAGIPRQGAGAAPSSAPGASARPPAVSRRPGRMRKMEGETGWGEGIKNEGKKREAARCWPGGHLLPGLTL